MSFHNDALIGRFEERIKTLVARMKEAGLKDDPAALRKMKEDFTDLSEFHAFRLWILHEVQQHMYFNVFRYDTERRSSNGSSRCAVSRRGVSTGPTCWHSWRKPHRTSATGYGKPATTG